MRKLHVYMHFEPLVRAEAGTKMFPPIEYVPAWGQKRSFPDGHGGSTGPSLPTKAAAGKLPRILQSFGESKPPNRPCS